MKTRSIAYIIATTLALGLLAGCAPAATPETEAFRVALVLPGSIDDASWNAAAYSALMRAQTELGVQVAYTEAVSAADAERVIRDYANQGYNLILGHSFDYGDALLSAAADFPTIYFGFGTGLDTAENVAIYDVLAHESAYLAGLLAGHVSQTAVLGIVGAEEIPTIVIQVNGFIGGVHEVNPDIEVMVTYVGSWDDAQGGREAAEAQLSAGADLIYSLGDHTGLGAAQAAEEAGALAIGSTIDQYELAPGAMVTSVVTDFYPVFEAMILDARAGNFGQDYTYSMANGASYLAPYHDLASRVPSDVQTLLTETADKIKNGELVIEPEWPE